MPHTLSLIRDRAVCVPRLEDVDGHIIPVSDPLPANEEIGEDGSGIGSCVSPQGVKGTSVSRTLKNSVLAKRNVGSSKVTLA